MKKLCLLMVVGFSYLFADTIEDQKPQEEKQDVSLEQINKELTQAQKDFDIAKKMFNPWYGGPLLTGSGNVMPPGYVNINPVVQITDNYAVYNSHRKSISQPDLVNVNPSIGFGFGIVKRVEFDFTLQANYNHKQGKSYFNIGDTSAKINLALLIEKPYVPALKISVNEVFPTGKYQNFSPSKSAVESMGSGSYRTEFGLGMSKVVWWWITHPMQFRLSLNYGVPTKVIVQGFNSYGGGYNTDGKVNPGNYFKGSFGYEFSFTQKFLFAIDLAYEADNETTFKGINGTYADGTAASNGSPSADVLSLAPALEYLFTTDISLVGGVWFSVCGRNTANFLAGIINFSYGF